MTTILLLVLAAVSLVVAVGVFVLGGWPAIVGLLVGAALLPIWLGVVVVWKMERIGGRG